MIPLRPSALLLFVVVYVTASQKRASSEVLTVAFSDTSTTDERGDRPRAIKDIQFCHDCDDPKKQGSHIRGLVAAKIRVQDWEITGAPLVYALPNGGSRGGLLNDDEMDGAVVMFDRGGEISIAEMIAIAQDSGARGAIIVDVEGGCREGFVSCSLGTIVDVHRGFGFRDDPAKWGRMRIPSLLVTFEGGARLKSGMDLITMDVGGYGQQVVMVGSDVAEWFHHDARDEL